MALKIDDTNYAKNTLIVYNIFRYVYYISFILLVIVLIKTVLNFK